MDRYPISQISIALLVTLIGAAFTYITLTPVIGIDDANITQVYARNLAAGHGYVYNIGGERVEGSTSLLWTAINLLAFAMSDRPEPLLTGVSFILCFGTVLIAIRISHAIGDRAVTTAAFCGALFLVFPPFFGWMIWSLMDTVLWVFLITLSALLVQRACQHPTSPLSSWFVLALLLPLTRPEGIALGFGLTLFYAVLGRAMTIPLTRFALTTALGSLCSFALVTLWRWSYFGYPVPNTYYAKSATDQAWQLKQGVYYAIRYVQEIPNTLFVLAIFVTALMILRRKARHQWPYLSLALYLCIGGVALYAVLGGDHFGGHRFYMYFLPVGLPLIAAVWFPAENPRINPAIILALMAVALMISTLGFMRDKGHFENEFRIAEDGRSRGAILNTLPGMPVVGVVAAGGIRMRYQGDIQDLLGLNWTVVAHAPDDARVARVINHRGFNQDVFWTHPPEIFLPYTGPCPQSWQPHSGFLGKVTDDISQTPRFRDAFAQYCYEGLVFHVSQDYLARIGPEADRFGWQAVKAD